MQANTLYQYQQGSYSVISDVSERSTRVSLFQTSQSTSVNSEQKWQDLLAQAQKDRAICFSYHSTHSLSILDLYLDNGSFQTVLAKVIKPSGFDYLIWPSTKDKPQLLVFDMDSTFIQIEVIDELAKQHGVGDSVSRVTEAAMRGELDFSESLISRVACLKGLSEKVIQTISEDLPLSEGVACLVESCHRSDVKIAIVSGGFTPFVSHLKDSMKLYKVKANDLEMKGGQLTGHVKGDIVDAEAKASFVHSLANELELPLNKIMTIGDGANDLKMMNVSGFSLAYRAKPAVQAKAGGIMNHTRLNHLVEIFEW